jgi:Fe2+ transport system protein FeoA
VKLSDVARGAPARISILPDGTLRAQFIRLGLVEGAIVTCLERLPGGTLILLHARQEVALSFELADAIVVTAP